MLHKLYNYWTHFCHFTLHFPLKLKATFDYEVEDPQLTVVFLHGIAATSNTWRSTLQQFSQDPQLTHTRLLAFDLLGFGAALKADWLNYDYDDYHNALTRSLKRLRVDTPLVLVGHSMGALIAAQYALRPTVAVQQLILVSPPILLPSEIQRLPDKFYLKSYSALPSAAQDPAVKMLANFVQKVSSFRADYLASVALAKAMKQVVLNPHNFDYLAQLRIPTTIIHGHFDPLVFRPNLIAASRKNPDYLKVFSVLGQHDISRAKRATILKTIYKVLAT